MNCIVASYLTTAFDPQRSTRKGLNDPEYIRAWYDSVVNLGLNGVILHDGLYRWFTDEFPKVRFIEVPPCGEYQLYDYRWIICRQFLKVRDIENVFFTDVSDVQVIKNPFTQKEYRSKNLYCGDESGTMNQNEWLELSLQSEKLCTLPGFKEMINSDRPMLNCGIFGGGKFIVMQFLSKLIPLIEQMKHRRVDQTVDMPLFNYAAHGFDFIHGPPVNSIFKGYENRNDAWFIHK